MYGIFSLGTCDSECDAGFHAGAGRAIFSGVVEMFARSFVAIVFVPLFGYTAICWTDQAAWIAAALYNTPMMLVVLRRIRREFTEKGISLDA